ncbi:DEAD/DEAH box helicase [Alcanivorax sp. 1008]|nr:DEAD/DEAH box helicase [Alcanivorax sp. 1008]
MQMLGLQGQPKGEPLEFDVEDDGVNFYARKDKIEAIKKGGGDPIAQAQYVALQMLRESREADQFPNGFVVSSQAAAGLDEEVLELLGLPSRSDLLFSLHISGQSTHPSFTVRADVVLAGQSYPFRRRGPFIEVGQNTYTLSSSQLLALEAIDIHRNSAPEERDEGSNLRLVATLQAAKRSGMNIDLSHFENLNVKNAERIGITIVKLPDGSIELAPNLGDGSSYSELLKRWHQIDLNDDQGVLRIGDRIVLLDKKQMDGIREVFRSRRISRDKVRQFMESPTAFIDAALVDLDCGFSVRVDGVGKMRHLAVGELDAQNVDWFGGNIEVRPPSSIGALVQSPEDYQRVRKAIEDAQANGDDSVVINGMEIDISDKAAVESALRSAEEKLKEPSEPVSEPEPEGEPNPKPKKESITVLVKQAEEQRQELLTMANSAAMSAAPDWSKCKRSPFPHQKKGIDWLVALGEQAQDGKPDDMYRLQGCVLADDMGLGKTYMSLVAVAELMAKQKQAGKQVKPVLVVAPLSLLENWEDEVGETFKQSPFRDIVVLQGGRDLSKFRVAGVDRETVQLRADDEFTVDNLRYALHVGPDAGPDRLDMDARLVLTTYQTLRDYQFSLCRIDWGTVIFDEAQNIKNPNTGVTNAAKALKSDFKILATGTPVENSLLDFWCIVDTAQPGLLGDWPVFREQYVKPILKAEPEVRDAVRLDVGRNLREAVGCFMLRRTKEEELSGLPRKTVYAGAIQEARGSVQPLPALSAQMAGSQLRAYDQVLQDYQSSKHAEDRQNQAIASLHRLRAISLHPRLPGADIRGLSGSNPRQVMQESAKLQAMLATLDEIRARKEKVIIFLITKKLQVLLKIWLDSLYGLDVGIINGDTKAVAKGVDDETRKGMIKTFEAHRGFNILIMSPVAAGVGLTVVGANNVIHLERHWNPAKEAQASDRVYRIGQERPVNIYLPAALHPQRDSFDIHLHRLLENKLMLKDAVVTTEGVSEAEISGAVLGD